ncbi:hypothetical protein AAFN85_13645 [Mucilaginibacter sp. CAU 1740]|uniref:hypothetical protein n=1 Tax=Mucilaginibacter sp. CAU 1740 TaxID=3140365 RepID=UPI00325C18EC
MKAKYSLSLLFSIVSGQLYAQSPSEKAAEPAKEEFVNPVPGQMIKDSQWGFMTSYEFMLSVSILIFGLFVIFVELYLIKTNRISQDRAVKFIIITLVIISTIYLITAGYNNNQIAPATGLLGTIAGYLLGRTGNPKEDE